MMEMGVMFFIVVEFRKAQNTYLIRLMVQKSGKHQLGLVVFPIIYKVIYIPGGAGCLPSTVASMYDGTFTCIWLIFMVNYGKCI